MYVAFFLNTGAKRSVMRVCGRRACSVSEAVLLGEDRNVFGLSIAGEGKGWRST